MSTFKERLEVEYDELLEKASKLNDFLKSENASKLSDANLFLLKDQIKVMGDYLKILVIRLELLK